MKPLGPAQQATRRARRQSSLRQAGSRRIGVVIFDGVQALDAIGPIEVFSIANRHLLQRSPGAAAPYAIEVLAVSGNSAHTNSGILLGADREYATCRAGLDTLLVAGGDVQDAANDPQLRRWLRATAPRLRRLASVCSGAFILAEAGLLDGRRATTHWIAVHRLQRLYPQVRVEGDAIFVRDGNVYTSAGVTAGIDLALALVEEDLGRELALAVARHLVVFLKRPGGQSQFSSHLAAQAIPGGALRDLPAWILEHLDEDLSVEALSARAGMSPRNFARVFLREAGSTPAKFVERARIDAARRELEDGSKTLEEVAARCGFGSGEHMRRTFQRHLSVVPIDYRRRFRAAS